MDLVLGSSSIVSLKNEFKNCQVILNLFWKIFKNFFLGKTLKIIKVKSFYKTNSTMVQYVFRIHFSFVKNISLHREKCFWYLLFQHNKTCFKHVSRPQYRTVFTHLKLFRKIGNFLIVGSCKTTSITSGDKTCLYKNDAGLGIQAWIAQLVAHQLGTRKVWGSNPGKG